jgi:hypothetical protein
MSNKLQDDENLILSQTGVEAMVVFLTLLVGLLQIFYIWGEFEKWVQVKLYLL